MWRELWFAMAGGSIAEYDRIKRIEVHEFWKLFDLWKAKVAQERELAKARTNQRKK
jgi:hypothetical protein